MSARVWFITGVSSGLGSSIAKQVALSGDTVIGTVRRLEQVADVDALVPGKTFGRVLDVNNHPQVREVVSEVAVAYGAIDVVVNNAGYGLLGAVEETTMAEARGQMETNFFGALAVTQAVLPHMRKSGSGNILQISSIAGIVGAPGLGLYDASKHALEGMSEALYHELKPLGIHVTIVEPGPFRTNWAGASMHHVKMQIDDYLPTAGVMCENLKKLSGNQPGDPERAGLVLLKVVAASDPPLRIPLGARAVAAITGKLDRVRDDFAAWREVAESADFPS